MFFFHPKFNPNLNLSRSKFKKKNLKIIMMWQVLEKSTKKSKVLVLYIDKYRLVEAGEEPGLA